MKVAWTARARTRLAEIHDYIAQDSKPRALAMVERILDRGEALVLTPRAAERDYRLSSTTKCGKSLKGRIGLFTEFLRPASRYSPSNITVSD